MKSFQTIFVKHPVSAEMKAQIRSVFGATRIRILDARFAGPEDEIFELTEKAAKKAAKVEKTPENAPKEPEAPVESSNQHGQDLKLVAAFEEKFGKKPHHNAKNETIETALSEEA